MGQRPNVFHFLLILQPLLPVRRYMKYRNSPTGHQKLVGDRERRKRQRGDSRWRRQR
jgi:hypothetical protein